MIHMIQELFGQTLRTKNPAMYWTSVLVGAGITIALIASSVFWKG
jgi:hypothetical protein